MSRFCAIRFAQPDNVGMQLKAATESALKRRGSTATVDDKTILAVEKFYKAVKAECDESLSDDGYSESSISNSALNIRGLVRALTEYFDAFGHCTLREEIETHVVSNCPTADIAMVSQLLRDTIAA